jgi:tRNA(adenine34) deaminase
MNPEDVIHMQLALSTAREAAAQGEVPVGAIIISDGVVVGKGYNRREASQSPLGHAEIFAIDEASRYFSSWRLSHCVLYVTLEPCIMCVGAILQARIGRLVYGCRDTKAGAVESLYRLCEDQRLNHQLPVTGGVLAEESTAILAEFFQRLRQRNRQTHSKESVKKCGDRWNIAAKGVEET